MREEVEGVFLPPKTSSISDMLVLYEDQLRKEFGVREEVQEEALSFDAWARLAMEHALATAEKSKPDSTLHFLVMIWDGVRNFGRRDFV